MELGDIVKIKNIKEGHYYHDNIHIWKNIKSGDVLLTSLSPDSLCMKCEIIIDKEKSRYNVGEISIDYFNQDVQYIGETIIDVKAFLYWYVKDFRKDLMDNYVELISKIETVLKDKP